MGVAVICAVTIVSVVCVHWKVGEEGDGNGDGDGDSDSVGDDGDDGYNDGDVDDGDDHAFYHFFQIARFNTFCFIAGLAGATSSFFVDLHCVGCGFCRFLGCE